MKTRACGANAKQRRERREKSQSNLGSNFAAINRNKYFDTHLKNPTQGPPIGAYRSKFGIVEPRVTSPNYGTEEMHWGKKAEANAKRLKDRSFSDANHKICRRLDRTIVLIRPEKYSRMEAETKSKSVASSMKRAPFSR